jgi:secreted PhoX family phosphatase
VDDPNFPEAKAGLVYEIFVDKNDPSKLDTDNPRDNVAPYDDGIAVRPALGSKSHEGMRFDKQGNYYGIHESDPGSIYRFVPDRKGDLSEGQLQALKTANHHSGRGVWVNLPDGAARIDAQAAANAAGANGYSRPEDVETGESTGRDSNNGGNTLYVAVTGTDEVLAVDLSSKKHPFAYDYVGHTAHNAPSSESATGGEFDYPDNLALDGKGNLAITEDPPTNPVGADIWVAEPPQQGRHRPAAEVARFASLKDCTAEPTGIYFALKGTERYTEGTSREDLVNDESLFVNRQHAGMGTTLDQFVSISPEGAN